ncbi:MAG: BirA family transcriptional regulator [Sphaerochaeta sp.]|nr:BirA family transcriptional regulator [Sphaerochaeta sp.]
MERTTITRMNHAHTLLHILSAHRSQHLSGQQLADEMGVSRTAVWKAMETLRNQGHVIEGIPNRGYRLLTSTLLYSKEGLEALLPTWELHLFDSIDSTNRYAKSLKTQKALVLACHQSEGRGRLSRSFYSPQGGIYLSVLFPAVFPLTDASLITSAAAVAVSEAIEERCGKYCQIKWVNDLFYENRKVCGILTEGVLGVESGRLTAVVVGIGLNLFTKREAFQDSLKTIATSLYDGQDALPSGFSVDELVACIVKKLEAYLSALGERSFLAAYRERSLVLGHEVDVHCGSSDYAARAVAIDDEAHLVVEDASGHQTVLSSGEVSIHLAD